MIVCAEYIWIDGQAPTKKLRSKQKILHDVKKHIIHPNQLPHWGHDGSSTYQAETGSSDCGLVPICVVPDPVRGVPHVLVLCEVTNTDGTSHKSNTRARLQKSVLKYGKRYKPWFGIEQEYTLYTAEGIWPYRWPEHGYPKPQGRFYCGVGSDEVYGRQLVEAHTQACIRAGLSICGTNGEVMPAQWEFQLGPLGPLEIADELWIARWLLYRLGEDFGISVKLTPKPIEEGDWNGAGAHVNFSTNEMREPGGYAAIENACRRLLKYHKYHMVVYGADNDKRLTGKHETSSIDRFSYGVSNRGASVRIPMNVAKEKCGYLEDRRPAANMDPYEVCTALIETVCGDGFVL